MKYNPLGRTGLKVSELCLGSMTWGTQNTETEGHAQIDYALDHGINFIDTAEMYPVPPGEYWGKTEEVIGNWFGKTGRREDVILATKVSGSGLKVVRDGADISTATITEAVEGSLKRLRTDYIDLYQLHWPNRGSYHFRQYWNYDPRKQNTNEVTDHIAEVLHCMDGLIKAGKIRHIGLSNESCWGTMQFLKIAEAEGLPRVASIQNEYSLLCRIWDLDLAEMSHHEDVGLLAFSPIGAGILSGKYNGDRTPEGSRRSGSENIGGRITQHLWPFMEEYVGVAGRFHMDPSQLALAWSLTRPGMTSAIFGATRMDQLETAIGAVDLEIPDEVLNALSDIHRRHPMPI